MPSGVPSWPRRALGGLLLLAGLALLLPSLAGLAAEWHWTLLLTTHFRPHYALAALLLALPALFLRHRPALALLAAVVLLNGWFLWQASGARAPEGDGAAEGQRLRVMSFNVNIFNREHEALLAAIEAADPDLLFLSEVVPQHAPLLVALAERYPYAALPASGGGQGEALFSRFPLGPVERRRPSEQASLWIVPLELPSGGVTLYGGHPLPAMSDRLDAIQAGWFEALAEALAARPPEERSLVMGDLNATPWSPRLLALMERHALAWTAPLAGSWPARLPAWLGLPIDHLLVSPGIAVVGSRLGEAAGSDHRPLIVDLLVR